MFPQRLCPLGASGADLTMILDWEAELEPALGVDPMNGGNYCS